jgi:hypothetical protein
MGKEQTQGLPDPTRKYTAEQYWMRAIGLLAHFQAKHTEIEKVRDITRLRKIPDKQLSGKYLITARNAMGWAIAQQMRGFFDPAPRKVEVTTKQVNKKTDEQTSKLEAWLLGSSEEIARGGTNPESDFIWNGIESGIGVLGCGFDPYRAKQGLFGLEVYAPDPLGVAYTRSHYGLTDFVTQESRTVAALREELEGYRNRAKGRDGVTAVYIPDNLLENNPQTFLEDTRYFTKEWECRFVGSELVYMRRHFLGRVPFDVAEWYPIPSDRPEESAMGVITPVRDLLESLQQVIDIYVTNVELGHMPLGILYDGQKYEIVQMVPGEEFNVSGQQVSLQPIPYNANQELLMALAQVIGEQLDTAALPRSTFSGPQFKLSGYAMDRYVQGVQSRVDFLKNAPERALASHYRNRLEIIKRFATVEAAKRLAPDDVELYLDSFNVNGVIRKEKGAPVKRVLVPISADDIPDSFSVNVDISPNVPADEAGRMQKFQASLQAGMPWEWAVRNVYKAENPDEVIAQHELDMLMQGDQMFREAYLAYVQQNYVERNKEFGRFYIKWMQAQGLMDNPNAPTPDQQTQTSDMAGQQGLPQNQFLTQDELAQIQQGGQAMLQGQENGAAPMSSAPPAPERVTVSINWKDLTPQEKQQLGPLVGINQADMLGGQSAPPLPQGQSNLQPGGQLGQGAGMLPPEMMGQGSPSGEANMPPNAAMAQVLQGMGQGQ